MVTSIADALVSVNPPLLELMFKTLKKLKGESVLAAEEEIRSGFNELARKGFFVEPSSAVAYAAFKKQLKNNEVTTDDKTLIILTGTGLKINVA